MHFSQQRLLSRSLLPATSATLSSYRFSLASSFLFYFWLSVSVRSRGSPGTRGPSKDASRSLPLAPLPPPPPPLPSQCLLRLLPSCSSSSLSSLLLLILRLLLLLLLLLPPLHLSILHGITSGDDGIPGSKTRSFEFVEILKDVVDLLSSAVLQLPRFQPVQSSHTP